MKDSIKKFTSNHPDWSVKEGKLFARFEFSDFAAIENVIRKMLAIFTTLDHHPTVTFAYRSIEVRTVTHDGGESITEKDFKLASAISDLVAEQ